MARRFLRHHGLVHPLAPIIEQHAHQHQVLPLFIHHHPFQPPVTVTVVVHNHPSHPLQRKRSPPIPRMVVSNLKKGKDAWREAVSQWENPSRKWVVSLKDWPEIWHASDMKEKSRQLNERCERWLIVHTSYHESDPLDCSHPSFSPDTTRMSRSSWRIAICKPRLQTFL